MISDTVKVGQRYDYHSSYNHRIEEITYISPSRDYVKVLIKQDYKDIYYVGKEYTEHSMSAGIWTLLEGQDRPL
jgi:hypothetical protein